MAAAKRARGKFNPSLHPRDSRGRFTRSATRVMTAADKTRARKGMDGFTPASITDEATAAAHLQKHASPVPEAGSALAEYLAGGWKETNATVRASKTPPPAVQEIDEAMTPLGEDMVLRRQVPLAMFAHIPVDQLVGMKVRDAAYASTMPDHPGHGPSAPDAVTLHIAAPAGTPGYVNAPDGEVLLARDTEIAITRAEPNGRGGWDLYGAVIPSISAPAAPARTEDRPVGADTEGASAGDPTGEPAGDQRRPRGADAEAGEGAEDSAVADQPAEDAEIPEALARFTPDDQARIRIGAEDAAPGIARSPLIGRNPRTVARYVAEGRLRTLTDRHGLTPLIDAVTAVLEQHPDILDRTDAQVDDNRAARRAAAEQAYNRASEMLEGGDARAALAEIDAGERIDPDYTVAAGAVAVDWDEMRSIVREVAGERGLELDDTPETGNRAPAGEPEQLDLAGGAAPFVPAPRSAIGLPDRPNVGRERAVAAVQQLGLFASDEGEQPGQMAMLDALLAMPAADPPSDAPRLPAADDPTTPAPASLVPEDLSGWNDEQLAELFRQVSDADDPATLDEAGLGRIAGEWERREQAMQALVASVPDADGLAALDEDAVMRLFADVTAALGTMDDDTVRRLEADLDRRVAAEQAAEAYAEQAATKRAYLAQDLDVMDDDQLAVAAGYAADLDDDAEIERVYAAWDAKEQAAAAAAAAAAREEADRAEAARLAAAQAAAEQAAAAAEAERERLDNLMSAARAAALVPNISGDEARNAATVLKEEGLRRVLGDTVVDGWLAAIPDTITPGSSDHWFRLVANTTTLPADDRARLVYAAADADGAAEFAGKDEQALHLVIRQGMFTSGPDWGKKHDAKMRAGREMTRRRMAQLRTLDAEAFARFRQRAVTAPVRELTDSELSVAPALLTDLHEPDLVGRLGEVEAEARRRQADLERRAAAKSAGPQRPARVGNPVGAYAAVERYAGAGEQRMRSGYGYRGGEAAERWATAKRRVLGLPDDADDRAIRAAERKDPRPLPDRAAAVLAWYRLLGEVDGVDRSDRLVYDWMVGPDDDPGIPDTPDPQPPANIAKPADVWETIRQTAQVDMQGGTPDTGLRFLRAIATAYRIPWSRDVDDVQAEMRRLQPEVSAAISADDRTPNQRAALFVAELRVLAAADGIDPALTDRYGPPDRGTTRVSRGTWRAATADEQVRIDRLVAGGADYIEAHAEVLGIDPDVLRRQEAGAVAAGGSGGDTTAKLKQAYEEHVRLQVLAADVATRGNLLSAAGKAKGIDPAALFSGPFRTARPYASEELLRWWGSNPRLTFADYKAQVVGGGRAAREMALAGQRGNEFL